jgi:hypothetical protein
MVAVVGCGTDPVATTSTIPLPTTSIPETTSSTASITTTSADDVSTTGVTGEVGDLLVIGDWGTGTLPQGAVAGQMMLHAEGEPVAAIVTTGDNLYSDDWEFVLHPYGWAAESSIPFWVSWGNHDVETASRIEAVNSAFDDPPRWAVHEWGRADIVIVDSTQVDSEEQTEFLTETLTASERPTIVVMHHPPFSCGEYDDSAAVIERWFPLFDEDVILVLSGHDHNYQRFEQDQISYLVSGGGGQSLNDLTACATDHPPRVDGEAIHHFLILEQEGPSVSVSAVDVNGNPIDDFEVALP